MCLNENQNEKRRRNGCASAKDREGITPPEGRNLQQGRRNRCFLQRNHLSRRYLRNIKENTSFYVSATLLTVATVVLFFLCNLGGHAILDFSAHFFVEQNIEDAHFTTYLPISEEEAASYEEEYDLDLELQYYVNVDTEGVTTRVFKKNTKINLYAVTEGKDLAADDEILISEGFAVANKITVGDTITVGEKAYTVCGFFQRPDYLYMLENEDDAYKNITTFFLAYVTDSAFETLGEASVVYQVCYHQDNSTQFRQAIQGAFYMRSYSAAEENMRIRMVNEQAEMFIIMSYIILCICPLVAVILVSVIISRKVKSEQKLIGTLSALGYSRRSLIGHYMGFAAIPGVLGGVLSVLCAAIFVQPFALVCLQDYEPMDLVGRLRLLDCLLAILIPTVFYLLAAYFSVKKLLKKETIQLLFAGEAEGEGKGRKLFRKSRLSFRTKYALRSLLGSPVRGLVVLVGVCLGCLIMIFGFAVFDSMDNMINLVEEGLGSYEYEYVFSSLQEENLYGGAKLFLSTVEAEDGSSIALIGTEEDNPYFLLQDASGADLNVTEGYFVTSILAQLMHWNEGDTIRIFHPLTLEEHTITITGIVENTVQKAIFTSLDGAAELCNMEKNTFNALASDKQLSIPEEELSSIIRKAAFGDQMQAMIQQMYPLVWVLLGLGMLVCIAAVYVAVNMMVEEQKTTISMLKILGYSDRKIYGIVLSVQHIFLPLGILLSIPVAYGCSDLFFWYYATVDGILMPTVICPRSFVICILVTSLCYGVSLFLALGKVRRVELTESLKENRE